MHHRLHKHVSVNEPTSNSQTTPIPIVNHDVPVDEAQARARRPFFIPKQRGRSERIMKKKLAKQHSGIGSSSTNALNLE